MKAGGDKGVVLSGIGQSEIGRRLGRTGADLTIEACLRAISDAGLRRGDIDGMAAFPGPGSMPPGMSGPGIYEVQDSLRLPLNWYSSGFEVPGQFGALFNACNAIAAGVARHVLVYRTVGEGSAAKAAPGQAATGIDEGMVRAAPWLQWLLPYHGYTAVNLMALQAQRHMHDFGLERRHLGALAVHARRMAAENSVAIYREPISMDEYLSSRMISTPLALYDCDVPCDGSTAFVLSSVDFAGGVRQPLKIEALGCASGPPYWEPGGDLEDSSIHRAANHLWARTDLKPGDVDVAELYDGFTYLTVCWLEALFCGVGEGGGFIGDGSQFGPRGAFPLNTDGGQLAAGRLHGFGKLYSAAVQLRDGAQSRQVPEAEVAMVTAGGAVGAGCLLLTR